MATRSSCVQRPAAVGRAVLGAAARSERVLRGVVRIEEVEVRLGQDVSVVESGVRSSHLAAAEPARHLADEVEASAVQGSLAELLEGFGEGDGLAGVEVGGEVVRARDARARRREGACNGGLLITRPVPVS